MSKPTGRVYICDACNRERREGRAYSDNGRGGIMSIVPDGLNGVMTFIDLCPECRSRLFAAFDDELKTIRLEIRQCQKTA